jgi:hypothetical protein
MAAIKAKEISKWRIVFAAILLSMLAVFLGEGKEFVLSQFMKERSMNQQTLGGSTETQIFNQALDIYKEYIIDSGIQHEMKNLGNGVIFFDKAGFDRKINQSMDGVLAYISMMFYRFYELLLWVPLFIGLAFGALTDAYFAWRREQWRFSFTSPFNIAFGARIFNWSFFLFFVAIGIPLMVPSMLFPVLFAASVYGLWLWGSNLQKRL